MHKIGERMKTAEGRRIYCPEMSDDDYQHFLGEFDSWLLNPLTIPTLCWLDAGCLWRSSPMHLWVFTMMNLALDPVSRKAGHNLITVAIMCVYGKVKDLDLFCLVVNAEMAVTRPFQRSTRLLLPPPSAPIYRTSARHVPEKLRGKPLAILPMGAIFDLDAAKAIYHHSGWMGYHGCIGCNILGRRHCHINAMSWQPSEDPNDIPVLHSRRVLEAEDLYIPLLMMAFMCFLEFFLDIMHVLDMGVGPDVVKIATSRGVTVKERNQAPNTPHTFMRMTKAQIEGVDTAIENMTFTKDGGRRLRRLVDSSKWKGMSRNQIIDIVSLLTRKRTQYEHFVIFSFLDLTCFHS